MVREELDRKVIKQRKKCRKRISYREISEKN